MVIVEKNQFTDAMHHRDILTIEFYKLRQEMNKQLAEFDRYNTEARNWLLEQKADMKRKN